MAQYPADRTDDVSARHHSVWERQFPYELRALRLVGGVPGQIPTRLFCGDRSGRIACLEPKSGMAAWSSTVTEKASRICDGPVYDFAALGPCGPDGQSVPVAMACATLRGHLAFVEYASGEALDIHHQRTRQPTIHLGAPVLSLAYLPAVEQLWAGLADGTVRRLQLQFSTSGKLSVELLPWIHLGEPVSGFGFIPHSPTNPWGHDPLGVVAMTTKIGNVYVAGVGANVGIRSFEAFVPIRSCLAAWDVALRYGSNEQPVVIACGGSIRILAPKAEPDQPSKPIGTRFIGRHCADRVMCLGVADFGDAAWIAGGAGDARLHFYRFLSSDSSARDILGAFGDRHFSIRLPNRVIALQAEHDTTRSDDGCMLYVALGNHSLKGVKIAAAEPYEQRVRKQLRDAYAIGSIEEAFSALQRAPDDRRLGRDIAALLFRSDWLKEQLEGKVYRTPAGLNRDEFESQFEVLLYRLLADASVERAREMMNRLSHLAIEVPQFSSFASRLIRHIDKYCVDGRSLSDKTQNLDQLAEFNERHGGEHLFDAALFRAFISERRKVEQRAHSIRAVIHNLSTVEEGYGLGDSVVLASSYHKGLAYLAGATQHECIEFSAFRDGVQVEFLQHAMVWKDPLSGEGHLVFFYRDDGWTSIPLRNIAEARTPQPFNRSEDYSVAPLLKFTLPQPRLVPHQTPFWIYSSAALPLGLVAVGGRDGTVDLVTISQEDGQLDLRLRQSLTLAGAPSRVRVLSYLSSTHNTGQLIVGCDNGACYRIVFDGERLRKPQLIWLSHGELRAIACEADQILVGDSLGHVALLRSGPEGEFVPTWSMELDASVSGAVATTMTIEGGASNPEPVVLVSDTLGRIHLLRTSIPDYDYRTAQVSENELAASCMSLLSPETPGGAARVAVARFNHSVEIVKIPHRRECVSRLNRVVARMAVDRFAGNRTDLNVTEADSLVAGLTFVLNGDEPIATGINSLLIANSEHARLLNSLDAVAWRLASANVASNVPELLAYRLRYDTAARLDGLLAEVKAMASGGVASSGRRGSLLRLKYLLRFTFKALADAILPNEEAPAALQSKADALAHHLHDLCAAAGADGSDENLRCRLHVAHYFFRFATPETLRLMLSARGKNGSNLKVRSMNEFVADLLLEAPRPTVRQRTVQYIRRLVAHDQSRRFSQPFRHHLLPLLVERLRHCRGGEHDPLAAEILLCVEEADRSYEGGLQSALIASLICGGCGESLLNFLVGRASAAMVDSAAASLVAVLAHDVGVPRFGPEAELHRRRRFDVLNALPETAADSTFCNLAALVRTLSLVAVAFDPEGDPSFQKEAQREVLNLMLPPLDGVAPITQKAMRHLLDCGRSLIECSNLTETTPGQVPETDASSRNELYRRMRLELTNLVEQLRESDDVLRRLFFDAQICVRRRMEIELDFLTPLRFLQERDPASAEAATGDLADVLLTYAAFYHSVSAAKNSLLVHHRRQAGVRSVYLDRVGEPRRERFKNADALLRKLKSIVGQDWPEMSSAVHELFADPRRTSNPDARSEARWSRDHGVIRVTMDANLVGILVFQHDNELPDPSRQALSRMLPSVLVNEYMRAVHRERLITFTFHNIMQPIDSMTRMLQALRDGHVESRKQPYLLDELLDTAGACRLMITNNQNFTRMARGMSFPITAVPFNLKAEVEQRRRIVTHKHKAKGMVVTLLPRDLDALEIESDRVMVGDIVQNLLDNACKHSPKRGAVDITLGQKKSDVFISVSDRGPGLPPEVIDSLWQDGARGKRAVKTTREGLGLGLFMVKQYLNALNGEIWVDSGDTGTTFTVRLPRKG